jgi:type I site-specific restriction-modification system R (restriction) subunit
MMRPYQVYAVQAIVECIHQRCGNGYIWHTTGSGKTLTSFKASTLLKDTNHRIGELDLYCQDVQKRIKDQQFPNTNLPHQKRKAMFQQKLQKKIKKIILRISLKKVRILK